MLENVFRTHLENELARRCRVNPNYSLRAFARSLGISPSYLSMAFNSKRPFSQKMIRKLSDKTGFLFQAKFNQLKSDKFHFISDWYHFAILEIVNLSDAQPSYAWVAKKLKISMLLAKSAISRLIRLKMLEVDSSGHLRNISGNNTNLDDELVALARRKLQEQVLQKAIDALCEIPIELRDQSSMTMAIDSSLIPEARRRITEFRRELTSFLESGANKDHVYNLSISLYPLTREGGK